MKPYFDTLRNLAESVTNPNKKELAKKEAAVTSWEHDLEKNAGKLKVVRGSDKAPVEVIMKDKHRAAFVVNGKEKEPFDVGKLTGGSFSDPIPDLCLSGDLDQAYDIKAVHRFDLGERKAFYVLTGTAIGGQPGLVVHKTNYF